MMHDAMTQVDDAFTEIIFYTRAKCMKLVEEVPQILVELNET